MDDMTCAICDQPGDNCGRSNRRANGFDIVIGHGFRRGVVSFSDSSSLLYSFLAMGVVIFFGSTFPAHSNSFWQWELNYVVKLQYIPCSFKQRLNNLVPGKWLVAKSPRFRRFDLFLQKDESATLICVPY